MALDLLKAVGVGGVKESILGLVLGLLICLSLSGSRLSLSLADCLCWLISLLFSCGHIGIRGAVLSLVLRNSTE